MTEETLPAVAGPVERGVRALSPERAAFEAWCCQRWAGDRNALTIREDGEYLNGHVQFAWCAWQAARPKRDKVGAIYNVAAGLAQRWPLEPFDNMTEQTHIGHRQFDRVYRQADERVRVMACKLAEAVQAL